MNDTIKDILTVDKGTQWTFRLIAVAFSGLCIWMYLFRNGLPDGLAAMTTGAWTATVATIGRAVDRLESLTGKDIDGDGVIGPKVETVAPTPEQFSVVQPVAQVAQVQEVIPYDAESDPGTYNLSGPTQAPVYN